MLASASSFKKGFAPLENRCYNARFMLSEEAAEGMPPVPERSFTVFEQQVELEVGQVLQVGEVLLTILDIDGDSIHVQIESDDDRLDEPRGRREFVLSLPR
jgi:hypothetical protein